MFEFLFFFTRTWLELDCVPEAIDSRFHTAWDGNLHTFDLFNSNGLFLHSTFKYLFCTKLFTGYITKAPRMTNSTRKSIHAVATPDPTRTPRNDHHLG